MGGYLHNFSFQDPSRANQTYFVHLPYEYYDNYYEKLIRINCTSFAADEQTKRIIEGLNQIKKQATK